MTSIFKMYHSEQLTLSWKKASRGMNQYALFLLGLILSFSSCESEQAAQADIQAMLDQCALAVSTKNIELYMEGIPEDFVVYSEKGEVVSRAVQRAYALRDWAIIDSTFANTYTIDSLQVYGDSAIVYTFQDWERSMLQRDGIAKDNVRTTQRHREVWKKNKGRWFNYEIEELGGEIYLNGKLYEE